LCEIDALLLDVRALAINVSAQPNLFELARHLVDRLE
jgi:hypothetical protein